MTLAEKAVGKLLKNNFNLKKDEKVLVITDEKTKDAGNIFFYEASKLASAEMTEIPVGKMHGEEPPESVAKKMLEFDVILIATDKSLSHTLARKNASEKGARIASMPGITVEILERAVDVDYEKMKNLGLKLKELLTNGNSATVLTSRGTMISFSIKGRKGKGGEGGMCANPGDWDNFPAGEACIAPVEGTADGIFIVDASMGGIGKLKTPISIIMEKGCAVKISGGAEAEILKHILEKCGKESYQLAEFGIGTNPKAKVTGIVLEDEKAIGTCHLALGSNFSLGGTIKANCHLDGIIKNPTVFIDNKKIMDNGKFLV